MSASQFSLQSLIGTEPAANPPFVFDGMPVSHAAFSAKVEQTAAWLAAQGVGKGDVVAVWLVNRIEWIALLFAAARCGAIVAAVNTRYRSAEVAHLLKVAGAKLMVVEAAFRSIDFAAILADVTKDEVPALQRLAVVGGDAIPAHWPCVRFDAFDRSYPPAPPLQDDVDLPVLLYTTSGTTKGPKLVAHSQRTLATHAVCVATALQLSPERHSLLAMLPFCGTFGMTSLLGFIAAGATIHVLDAFEAGPALQLLGGHKITHAFGSDEMFRRILALADTPRPFPHLDVCGFAAFQQGVSGELEISAPSRFLGYFNNPEATRDAITADGFFRTGDIGRLHGDGAFVYETRAGDAMRLGGFLVAPGEIEDELKSCAGVADAQVVAVDMKGNARCVAFVIPAEAPPRPEALVARLRERLAGYKIPARIYIVDAFPVTDSANGVKIQRARLRAMAMEQIAAE
ncbi:AMP-binding protein [Bradyrhizobium sp. 139]|uniref:AMP-binding protein n=1 Tax=Bradyrhizobium sp. 139 TaxID=2782616 RepID=UPI001FFA0968|nr:AMP-binding protein [Bradyrhizobium sp. 139]MCK1740577.1 AMP-binding protein [Bradyrhizobium sp. 139]